MKIKSSLLTPKDISILGQAFETLVFPNDFDLIYENHVPPAGVILLEGKIELLKRSKLKMELTGPQLIGIDELLKGNQFPYGLRLKANTKVILIGKSEARNLFNQIKE